MTGNKVSWANKLNFIFFYLMLCSYPPICQIKHAKNMTLRWGRKTETQKKQIFLLDLYVQEVLYISILYMWLLWYDRLWSWLAKVAWVRTLHKTHGLQKGVMAPRRMQLQWVSPFSHIIWGQRLCSTCQGKIDVKPNYIYKIYLKYNNTQIPNNEHIILIT